MKETQQPGIFDTAETVFKQTSNGLVQVKIVHDTGLGQTSMREVHTAEDGTQTLGDALDNYVLREFDAGILLEKHETPSKNNINQ